MDGNQSRQQMVLDIKSHQTWLPLLQFSLQLSQEHFFHSYIHVLFVGVSPRSSIKSLFIIITAEQHRKQRQGFLPNWLSLAAGVLANQVKRLPLLNLHVFQGF